MMQPGGCTHSDCTSTLLIFQGMVWKEMVMMNKQALEVQGIATLRACRKMLKMFKVVRREKGINGPHQQKVMCLNCLKTPLRHLRVLRQKVALNMPWKKYF